ncbi:Protein of unknown function [Catalinimonas alkaloidigena]|uniref:DUF3826 domain-containing protein n=1 Tax=Catalinimonas alkaloidigena TaxID=1075417 RepID=A0A1G9IKP3_9BACT|nr:DUF3826 domain-containing protein [Catalinimonas alkaloidigena]SDL25720.1 Protein of unknown function [Catalinimonas alkaloidigena]
MQTLRLFLLISFLTTTAVCSQSADDQQRAKAAEWVATLQLQDAAKEARLTNVISTHLTAVRDWHNAHPASEVPEGLNPSTGEPLSELHRTIIAHSAKPASVHENLMSGLRKDLSEAQVEAILDQYTVGKVDFTMKAYREIVPNFTAEEESTIRGYLEQAREQAVDFKNMKEISAIFEIYKTKAEQYLNANGRNWRQMYKDYVNAAKARKAAEQSSN